MAKRRRQPEDGATLGSAFAELRADYDAAKQTRFRRSRSGVSGVGRSADYHYRTEADFLRMMELARDFDRNSPVIHQGLNRLIDNVIQDGIRLDPQTGLEEADAGLKERWHDWGSDPRRCHAAGKFDWHAIEKLSLRSVVRDGDIFHLPLRRGALESVEAHRCRKPTNTRKNVVHGVLLDRFGGPREYWFTRRDLDPMRALRRVKDTKAFRALDSEGRPQVFHIFNPDRFSQTRGVTHLAPAADITGMHDDLQFAQLVKAQIASVYTIIHERELDWRGPDLGQRGEQETEELGDGSTRTIEGLAPGMEIFGTPGSKIKGFAPNIPNTEFFEHAMLLLTFVAINLNLPVAVLLLDPSKTNFSGWRGAIDQARMTFREIQRWLAAQLHRRVYEWKLRQWIAEDEEVAGWADQLGESIFRHRWNPPSWPYIEPLKDASADLMQQRNALNSPRRIQAARGRDWPEIAREIVEDNATAIRLAKRTADEINGEFPEDPVHWRELISLPTPDGVQVTLDGGSDDEADDGQSGRNGNNALHNRLAAVN